MDLTYTGGILQRLETDVHRAVTAKTSTALWQRKRAQRCDSDGADSNVTALTATFRLRAIPLFRYFRAGNGRFLGLAVWRNAGGGVGREQKYRNCSHVIVVLGPVHTMPDKFENATLLLRIRLPCTKTEHFENALQSGTRTI